ncbi:MAG TPA: hypothetical protein VFE37_01925 [Chloroflexota bacterium]|nr:hypothetical protein [Chloroflexota bacterium]
MAQSDEAPRPELLALLRAHGLSAAVAARVASVGAILHHRSLETGAEVGTTLDLATGRPIGPTLIGERDSVNFASQFAAFRPGRRYLQLHTHPGSSSFSAPDVGMLLNYPALRTLAVVGEDEHWYLLSKRAGPPTVSALEGVLRWYELWEGLATANAELITHGRLSEEAARVQEIHETMLRLAAELRLRYDDVGLLG